MTRGRSFSFRYSLCSIQSGNK